MNVELYLNDGEHWELHDNGSMTPLNHHAEQALAVQVRPLPAARLGRSSRVAGGVLVRLWNWLRLPRVERFRRCSRCGLVRDEDRARRPSDANVHRLVRQTLQSLHVGAVPAGLT